MGSRDGDRAALLRRYNAAVVTNEPITDDITSLSNFDGPQQDLDFDDDREFSLPMSHVPSNNLNTEDLQQANMDTPIASSNIGYKLLKKMGWKDQTGLGRNGSGIVDPIRISSNMASLGVGKLAEDAEYTNAENVRRKALDIEVELTPDQVKKREVQVEKEKAIKEEVAENRKVFFCELCNKQYKMITEYEMHLSSYDHNHKKRFQEMRQMERSRSGKKDTKVDKEMQRLMAQAAAAQQRFGPAPSQPAPDTDTPPPPPPPPPSEDPPPPPPSNEPPRPAIKFGFGKKPATTSPPHSFSQPPPPSSDPPPPPPPTDEPPRPAVKFGFSKKPAGNSYTPSHPPPPPSDPPPPPPPTDAPPPPTDEPPRPAVKFGFSKKPAGNTLSNPPPPPPDDVPPPPLPATSHPLPSQPVKFSFNMPKKR